MSEDVDKMSCEAFQAGYIPNTIPTSALNPTETEMTSG